MEPSSVKSDTTDMIEILNTHLNQNKIQTSLTASTTTKSPERCAVQKYTSVLVFQYPIFYKQIIGRFCRNGTIPPKSVSKRFD
ncbi:hypothetical protein H5410_063437 [Solanum commersonii]|uniref:Uncharacterized protein n=1 Tax=Solanum commersonii TaxID=4109 RepID=A0A9J5WEB8_SOLCO|nr:hypothetical protein H5410_063437 [Solanum commersonii]